MFAASFGDMTFLIAILIVPIFSLPTTVHYIPVELRPVSPIQSLPLVSYIPQPVSLDRMK